MTNIPDKHIERFRKLIAEAGQNLAAAEELLVSVVGDDLKALPSMPSPESAGDRTVEGIFNGQNLVADDGKVYPVQANYASKSRLVQGDRMKLTISPDGRYTFKQIGPIGRKPAVGQLIKQGEGARSFFVVVDDNRYQVLFASVTHHQLHEGDQVSISLPDDNPEATWAAIEAPL